MAKDLDARGISCPGPVLMAKKALAEDKEAALTMLVDNDAAAENLRGLGESLGRDVEIKPLESGDYRVAFAVQGAPEQEQKESNSYIVVLQGEEMGQGDPAFGKKLLEGFIYALTEQDHLPAYVLCYNKGVTLTTQNERTIGDLKALIEKGVQVLSCGLCLEYYGLKDKLQAGQVTNMYRICELMRSHPIVKP